MSRHPKIPDDWYIESSFECLSCNIKCSGNCYFCKCPLLPFIEEINKVFKRLEKQND